MSEYLPLAVNVVSCRLEKKFCFNLFLSVSRWPWLRSLVVKSSRASQPSLMDHSLAPDYLGAAWYSPLLAQCPFFVETTRLVVHLLNHNDEPKGGGRTWGSTCLFIPSKSDKARHLWAGASSSLRNLFLRQQEGETFFSRSSSYFHEEL